MLEDQRVDLSASRTKCGKASCAKSISANLAALATNYHFSLRTTPCRLLAQPPWRDLEVVIKLPARAGSSTSWDLQGSALPPVVCMPSRCPGAPLASWKVQAAGNAVLAAGLIKASRSLPWTLRQQPTGSLPQKSSQKIRAGQI